MPGLSRPSTEFLHAATENSWGPALRPGMTQHVMRSRQAPGVASNGAGGFGLVRSVIVIVAVIGMAVA